MVRGTGHCAQPLLRPARRTRMGTAQPDRGSRRAPQPGHEDPATASSMVGPRGASEMRKATDPDVAQRHPVEPVTHRVPGHGEDRLAEEVGFEPTVGCPTHHFQSCRFGRSRTPPGVQPGQGRMAPSHPDRPIRRAGDLGSCPGPFDQGYCPPSGRYCVTRGHFLFILCSPFVHSRVTFQKRNRRLAGNWEDEQ